MIFESSKQPPDGQRHKPLLHEVEGMGRRTKPENIEPLLNRMMALAEPSRWNIIQLLREEPHTVGQLATATGLSLAVISRHVQRLRSVGLVIGEKKGKELHCSRSGADTDAGKWLALILGESHPITSDYSYSRLTPRSSRPEKKKSLDVKLEPVLPLGGDIEDFLL